MKFRHRFAGVLVSGVILGGAVPLHAQSDQSVLAEVVVTAQKREQSAQDVPIAISALSADDLRSRGINSAKDIANAVPNLVWAASDSTNVANVYIRGVGDSSFHTNQVGAVGMYSDEISLNSPLLWNFGLFDLARVEVLRGPQNTLFGRNTTGGAIQFESRTPKVGEASNGYLMLNGGNRGRIDVEAAASAPIGDTLAMRVAFARFEQGNYIDNLNLNRGEGGSRRTAGRVQLQWQPNDDLTVLANFHAGKFRGHSTRYKQVGLSDPANPGFSDCPFLATDTNPGNGCSDQTGFIDNGNVRQNWSNSVDIFDIDARGALLRFDWKIGGLTLTSLSGYERAKSQRAEDSTGGPSFIFNFEQGSDTKQYSQEFRLSSTLGESDKWLAGIYYFKEDLFNTTAVRRGNPILSDATTPGAVVPEAGVLSFIPFTILDQQDRVWSAYARDEHAFNSKWSLTAGLRFTSERKSGLLKPGAVADLTPLFPASRFIGLDELNQLLVGATQVGPGPLPPQCPPPFPLGKCYELLTFGTTWNIFGGNVSLNYKVSDDVLTYLSIARGFKGGGVSAAALDSIVGNGGSVVQPEYLWTYEVGMKSEWLDHRLRFNAAAFYNRWTNEQLFLAVPTPLGLNPVLTNVPKTESQGVEFDMTSLLPRGWSVQLAGGLLHTKASDVGSIPGAVQGSRLTGAPNVNGNAVIRKQWDLSGGRFGIQGDARYSGSVHWDLGDTPELIEPSYWLFNASADYAFGSDGQYQLTVWGKNLSQTQYCYYRSSNAGLGFGDIVECAANEGTRFFGASIRVSFK